MSQRDDHFVTHVTFKAWCETARRRMRRDNGRLAELDYLPECIIRDMTDINHDPNSVHFLDDFDAKLAEPVPLSIFVVGRIRNMVRQAMCQRDVANSTVMEMSEV
jgi:hypothetical protein